MKKKHKTSPKVGIFGGSFNPPHKGHIKICDHIIKQKLVDQIWLMPCFNHNMGKLAADPLHRIEMLHRCIKGKKSLSVSMHEILHESDGKMFNTMTELVHTFPHIDFSIIVGMDCAIDVHKHWYKGTELTDMFRFIIVNRYDFNYPDSEHWFNHRDHLVTKINFNTEYSSTLARKSIINNDNELQEKLMIRPVINYIKVNNLYV